jgi:hypothetical protein
MNIDLPPPIDPAPPTAPGPRPAGEGLVEWVRASRPAAAYVLLGLSALFLAATVWLAVRAARTTTAEAAPGEPPTVLADPKAGDYTAAWVGTLYGFLVTAGAGAYLLAGRPPAGADARAEARVVILAVGGLLGLGLMLFGGVFFWRWGDSLAGWLDKGERGQMVYVVAPLLMVVAGAGLVFAAVQPARAEERHNPLLRRLVYGSNLGLTVLLLLLVLVVANVAVAKKVPNKLDTTQTGFYTLSDSTKALLAKLPEPATLYVIMPSSEVRWVNDLRQFAYEVQDASGGKVTARFVSPVSDSRELARLREKFPRIDRDALGVLLAVGEDERRNAFIPFRDLFDWDQRGFGGSDEPKAFAGEGRVMKELRFLADNEQKPVVYFTQGSGELALAAGGPAAPTLGGSAAQLKAFLEKNYLDIRPLAFPPDAAAEVPADAAAVVVIDPQSPLPEGAVGAVRKYMAERKGRLVVAAGAAPGPGDRGVARTGLEDLLREYNVRLGDRFVYSYPTEEIPDHRAVAVILNPDSQNPIAQAFGSELRAVILSGVREVEPQAAAPAYQASPLMFTLPGLRTWLSADRLGSAEATQLLVEARQNREVVRRIGLTQAARPVAAVVSEGGTARAVVFGSGSMFADRAADRGRTATPITYDLMAAALDWLRDKPPLPTTVEAKTYQEYLFPEPAAVDTARMVWFPLGLGLLVVAGLGAGVWVIRRK